MENVWKGNCTALKANEREIFHPILFIYYCIESLRYISANTPFSTGFCILPCTVYVSIVFSRAFFSTYCFFGFVQLLFNGCIPSKQTPYSTFMTIPLFYQNNHWQFPASKEPWHSLAYSVCIHCRRCLGLHPFSTFHMMLFSLFVSALFFLYSRQHFICLHELQHSSSLSHTISHSAQSPSAAFST